MAKNIVVAILAIISGIALITVFYYFLHEIIDRLKSGGIVLRGMPYSSIRNSWIKQRREKVRQIVESTSEWYKQVRELNECTHWNKDILDDGHSECYLFADTKAQYDRAQPQDRIRDFLIENRDRIVRDRELVRQNWDINEAYEQRLQSFSSSISHEACQAFGISYEEYTEMEKELVDSAKIPIIIGYGITCHVVYISPQGRKRYEKEFYFDDFDIDDEYMKIDRKKKEEGREKNRRQLERARITPSLRYDIMQRDRFRCCICGRSADMGVELEVDHIIPISKGGTSDMDNLQTLCRDCNRGKGAKY